MKSSPYFFLDVLYIHELPSADNSAQVISVFFRRIIRAKTRVGIKPRAHFCLLVYLSFMWKDPSSYSPICLTLLQRTFVLKNSKQGCIYLL